jgi:hypothetical protein
MEKLEAEAKTPTTSTQEEVPNEEVNEEAQTPDELQALKEQLAKQEKALKDTQRWAHKNSSELAALKREREELLKQQSRPAILDDNPGLEEAIKHIATPTSNKGLVETLETALPQLDSLLDEEDFKKVFFAKRDESIDAWKADPLSAVRDISALQTQYLQDKAVANAQKDFTEKKKKLSSMSVPGGSGGKGMSKEVDEVKQVWEMSKADFDKQRAKVMGY